MNGETAQEMVGKVCDKCNRLLPLTEFYSTGKQLKYKKRTCKNCVNEQRSERGKTHPHRYNPAMYKKHRAEWLKKLRDKYKNNPEFRKKKIASRLAWQREHKEEANAQSRQWIKNNPDRYKERIHIWKQKKRKNDPAFKLITSQRSRLQRAINKVKQKKTKHTIQYLGCSILELQKYLAKKFTTGMTWENHGKRGWHVDHIKPLSSFDFSKSQQIERAFHYSNLQPLWWFDNLKKGSKIA